MQAKRYNPLTMSVDIAKIREKVSQKEKRRIDECWEFAVEHLTEVKRRSGESYAQHGYEVAKALSEITNDPTLLCVALLHDIQMHKNGNALLGKAPLSKEEKTLVRKMHALRRLHIDHKTEDLDQVIDALSGDVRLLPLRMAHRVNDIRYIDRFQQSLQKSILEETLYMYTAIAGRLNMQVWRYELEDICFLALQPKIAKSIKARLDKHRATDEACLKHAKRFLLSRLRRHGIPCTIEMRIKGLYSTYRKMLLKERKFDELTDRLALRIIVDNRIDCYRALSIVHWLMHPIPGKLKDYIGAPKENGYRSIHTVVYPLAGISEYPIEIQIRSKKMHERCEFGMARHSDYKDYLYAMDAKATRVNLFRNLESLQQETSTPAQFEKALRTYFSSNHYAIFDEKNNLYHIKQPLTALDFACHVHGNKCKSLKGVKINGRERSIGTTLQDGDTVEVQFGHKKTVSRRWLHKCEHEATKQLISKFIT